MAHGLWQHLLHLGLLATHWPTSASQPTAAQGASRRNLIFMISDGFGQASEGLARAYMEEQTSPQGQHSWASLLDDMLVGTTRTRSANTWVTDSAAGATAFACGRKSPNGAIGVAHEGAACATVLEAAKMAGYATGLVTTARITHATPAAFAAHARDRDMEDLIARQMLRLMPEGSPGNHSVDLMFGGGRCHFLPQGNADSCRMDGEDLWQQAEARGVKTLTTRQQFDALAADAAQAEQLPLLGLFAKSHLAYSIDRDASQPTLSEMASKALALLNHTNSSSPSSSSSATRGFFLMIEGARIDMAAHDNDPAAHLHEILEYWRTVRVVRDFVEQNPEDTLLVSTSDHETGGLTLGRDPEYLWHPQVLHPVSRSAERICGELRQTDEDALAHNVRHMVLPKHMGVGNATEAEVAAVVRAAAEEQRKCRRMVGEVVSARARLGWTTGGHTGADVGLYAFGSGSDRLHGCVDNTQVGRFLAEYLGVDGSMDELTRALAHVVTEQPGFERTVDRRMHVH
ncbi:vacuolar alkaline phosphatase [Coemansia erecta]|uniref:Alkaline phosphatase n=1 Tax=Coemansia erecta TaxID=147472 RepID=A0A9W8CT43_9FUNG|nr:vacuolar alkaline phosphatase [Coemansia erecta]